MKYLKIISGCIVIFIVLSLSVIQYKRYTFTEISIRSITNLDEYTVLKQAHNNHQWYVKLKITESNAEKILELYKFKQGYNEKVLAGKVQPDYSNLMKQCINCWYYLEDKKSLGPYGYILLRLSENKKQLEILKEFG